MLPEEDGRLDGLDNHFECLNNLGTHCSQLSRKPFSPSATSSRPSYSDSYGADSGPTASLLLLMLGIPLPGGHLMIFLSQ